MGKIQFDLIGAESPEKLNMEYPQIFRAARKFPTPKSKADASLIPTNSVTIPRAFTEKLEGIHGKFLLRQYKGEWRDMHLYSDDAVYIDGVCRICYLEYSEERDALRITECGTIRNSGYSGLYQELGKRLREKEYTWADGAYFVEKRQIENFVKLVNGIITDKKNGVLELYPTNEIDSMSLVNSSNKAQKYYYFKAYWDVKDMDREQKTMPDIKQTGDMEKEISPALDAIRKLGELSVSGTLDEVRNIKKTVGILKQKLDKVEEWTLARLAMIEGLKEL